MDDVNNHNTARVDPHLVPMSLRFIINDVAGIELPSDAEYHAFEYATRRTLEYTAKGIGDFLNIPTKRGIYKLENDIAAQRKEEVDVVNCWAAGLNSLADMLQARDGETDTIRNLITHHEPVDGGQVSITRRSMNITSSDYDMIEVSLIGGGEQLFPWTTPGIEIDADDSKIVLRQTLYPQLENRFKRLVKFVAQLYEVLAVCPSR